MAGVGAFERMIHPAAPFLLGGEVEGETGVCVLEAAVDVAMGVGGLAPFVAVDVGRAEIGVPDGVAAGVQGGGFSRVRHGRSS